MNLRRKITALLLVVSIVSVSIVAVFGYFQVRDLVTEAVFTMGEAVSEKHALEINEFFTVQTEMLEGIVSDIVFEGSLDEAFLNDYVRHKTDYNQHSMTVYYASPTREDGFFISGDEWVPGEDYDWTARPWFIDAKNEGATIMTNPYVDATTGGLVITIAKPVVINGTFQGVVGTDISIDTVVDVVQNANLRDRFYASLIDNRGYLVAHPNSDFITEEKIYNINEFLGAGVEEIVTTGSSDIKTLIDYDGKNKLFIGTKLAINGWHFLIAADEEVLTNRVNNSRNMFLFIMLVVITIAVIISFIFTKLLTKPLHNINAHAQLIA
ncbi:MAG: cache domain-containing protein, partial [Clostridiaceae bacterium]|nr:cache domain-containing protein [Clostridiaceae bacterium]